jgi:hypothetical protein
MRRFEVREGQRYCKSDAPSSVWIVAAVLKEGAGPPHARLISASEQTTIRTVAIAALKDPRLYRLVSDSPAGDQAA